MIISANSSLRSPSISLELKSLLHFCPSEHFCPLTLCPFPWEQQSHPQAPRVRINSVCEQSGGHWGQGHCSWAVPAQGRGVCSVGLHYLGIFWQHPAPSPASSSSLPTGVSSCTLPAPQEFGVSFLFLRRRGQEGLERRENRKGLHSSTPEQ